MKKPSSLKLHATIHLASLLHGGTAVMTAQLPGGDTIFLTAETVGTLMLIASFYGIHWTKAAAITFAKQQIANYYGVKIGDGLVKYVPLAGNVVHGGVSALITETICWALVREMDMLYTKENGGRRYARTFGKAA